MRIVILFVFQEIALGCQAVFINPYTLASSVTLVVAAMVIQIQKAKCIHCHHPLTCFWFNKVVRFLEESEEGDVGWSLLFQLNSLMQHSGVNMEEGKAFVHVSKYLKYYIVSSYHTNIWWWWRGTTWLAVMGCCNCILQVLVLWGSEVAGELIALW